MIASLPFSPALQAHIVKFAEASMVTVEEFILLAVAEKVASMEYHEWLTSKRKAGKVDPCSAE